ncbi:MAG: AAA family ATPase [Muribaculaceae bacterium]|nr:AAA family ATPase [Muribaculaceae bacterium]
MIHRNLLHNLRHWARKPNRKPLVIRGARQVGKTTLVKEFSAEFDGFIHLNLERPADRRIFDVAETPAQIMEILRLIRLKKISSLDGKRILLFFDEIQSDLRAIGMLRYFYEDMPELYVIAAGSRLQELFMSGVSFPVGRVEYMSMRPCFFDEFLGGLGLSELRERVLAFDVPDLLHDELGRLFRSYALVGGMPEVVATYADCRDVAELSPLYRGLLQSYDEDVEKYASSSTQVNVLRHLLRSGWNYAGQTVSFARFGGSSYTSTSVHQAFELLEKAFIVSMDYPVTSVKPPLQQAFSRSPKLVWLDTGLVNFSAGVQVEYLTNTSIADVWRGHAAEQIVGQELWQLLDRSYADVQAFWVRDKKGSNAEVDFVYPYEGMIIPIEVKSGANAHLRSLQSYMSMEGAPSVAVRGWPGAFSVEDVLNSMTGTRFRLVNLPYYLVGQIDKVLKSVL